MRKFTLLLFFGPFAWVRLTANDNATDPIAAWDQTVEQARSALIVPQTLRDQCPTPPVNLASAPIDSFLVAEDAPPKLRTPRNGILPAPEAVDPGILHKRLDQAPPAGASRRSPDNGYALVLQIAASYVPAPDMR